MTDSNQKQLGKILWNIADQLRGAMNADDFRDYMLAFLVLRYLSDNYETAAKRELGRDYPALPTDANNPTDVVDFEKQMRRKVHYVNPRRRSIKSQRIRVQILRRLQPRFNSRADFANVLGAQFDFRWLGFFIFGRHPILNTAGSILLQTRSRDQTWQPAFRVNLVSVPLVCSFRRAKICTPRPQARLSANGQTRKLKD